MTRNIPFRLILEKAKDCQADMACFSCDMVAIPNENCDERHIVYHIKEEIERVGLGKVGVDPMDNVLGYIGHSPCLVATNAHIGTVGVDNIKSWDFDPYKGMETDGLTGDHGTSDQEGSMVSMIHVDEVIKDFSLRGEYTLLVTSAVQGEDCDGLCW